MSAQSLAPSMQVRLHRADRDVENPANVLVASSFLIEHHETCPLSFTEEPKTLFDDGSELRPNHVVQRVTVTPRQALVPATLRIVERGQTLSPLVNPRLLVVGDVHGNAIEERRQ